jgi:hypothetical protein
MSGFFWKSMNEMALSASNIYIANNSVKYSKGIVKRWIVGHNAQAVGWDIGAVKNCEKRCGRHFNFRMDFAC